MAKEKIELHPRNKNRTRYDLEALVAVCPELKSCVKQLSEDRTSIDFSNPAAVKLLNKAILNYYYGITYWEFPEGNLCPPIPGRADYIHYIADLLSTSNFGTLPQKNIHCLDIGVGASCIYPILGVTEYDWQFTGVDVSKTSLKASENIIAKNKQLNNKVALRMQAKPKNIFKGIIGANDYFDVTICNPPFHASKEEALKGTKRKVKNLTGKTTAKPVLNFSGVSKELIYKGGETKFIQTMILESKHFAKHCFWFTTLVSKQSHLRTVYKLLKAAKATQIETITMGTGNKVTRIVAWSFLNSNQCKDWRARRWRK